tara:strand:+ start:430 stop:1236 length:807 start_codon:yes stop_codon:yes gene_type:complete
VSDKLITTFAGADLINFPNEAGKDIYNFLFETGDLFICITNFTKQLAVGLGCDESKIKIIHMGSKVKDFPEPNLVSRKKRPLKLLTVGRISEEKGHKYAIDAMKILSKDYSPRDLTYNIVGDGVLSEEIKEKIKENGLENYVNLLGAVKQEKLFELYGDSSIFILPSISGAKNGGVEGQGVVLQEAQCSQIPVIASKIGGIPESFIDKKTGFLVEERNPEEIAEKVKYFLKNKEMVGKMGAEGRKFVEREYNVEKLSKQLIKVYQGLS